MNLQQDDFRCRDGEASVIDSWKCMARKLMPTILAMAILGIPLYLCTRHFRGDFIKVILAIIIVYRSLLSLAGLILTRREERLAQFRK